MSGSLRGFYARSPLRACLQSNSTSFEQESFSQTFYFLTMLFHDEVYNLMPPQLNIITDDISDEEPRHYQKDIMKKTLSSPIAIKKKLTIPT